MSPATCQRWIVLGLVGTIAWGGGCTAARPGSLPKWNLAWWKKDSADPKTRHDELAPPSSTISPSASIAAIDPPSAANTPSRKPYQVDGDAPTKSGPPAPRSFELSKQNQAAPQEPARPQAGSGNSQPIGATVADSKSSAIPDSYESRFSNQSSGTMSEQSATGDQPIAHLSQDPKPARYTNPYVTRSASPSTEPLAKDISSPTISGGATNSGSVYTRTPYNAFTPKSSTSPSLGASPLRPLAPGTTPAPATKGLPNIRPVGSTPDDISAATNPASSPPIAAKATTLDSEKSSLPDILLQSQGSYTPGSIRTMQPNTGTVPVQTQSPVNSVPSASPAASTPSSSSTTPTTGSTIGGGGSFMLSK